MEEEVSDESARDQEEDEEGDESDDKGVEEQVDKFFAELDLEHDRQKKRLLKEGAPILRRRSVLPHHLHSVMGSANLSLARGDLAGASELCMEVIRQAPHVVEPFLTLATIYEDQRDKEKLLQILLIAAHLKRSDSELWERVGHVAIERNCLSLAAQCFSKASLYDHTNVTLLWQSATLYKEAGEVKKAIEKYEALLRALPRDGSHDFFEATKELAKLYHSANTDYKAVSILKNAVSFHPSGVDEESINLLSDLLLADKCYEEAYMYIVKFYGLSSTPPAQPAASSSSDTAQGTLSLSAALSMSMSAGDDLEPVIRALSQAAEVPEVGEEVSLALAEVPDDMSVDLRSKLIVCMIHMKITVDEALISPLSSTPEEYGDLLLDIAEAYIDCENFSKALPLLSALINTESFSQAEVWLKHAECLYALDELEAAAISYARVLSLAPHHTQTRLSLASLYNQMGLTEDALTLLDNVPGTESDEVMQDEIEPTPQDSELFSTRCQTQDLPATSSTITTPAPPPSSSSNTTTTLTSSTITLSMDIRILLSKFNLLSGEGRDRECADVGWELLVFLFRFCYNRTDLLELFNTSAKRIRFKLRENEDEAEREKEKINREQENLVKPEEWWNVFMKCCKALYKTRQNDKLKQLMLCAHVAKKFDESHEKEFTVYLSAMLFYLQEHQLAFFLLRRLCPKDINNPVLWNLFNVLYTTPKVQKFALRLLIKNPSHLMLLRISANYSLVTGSNKFALAQYEIVYRQQPNDPLLCLCIATVYLNMAVQKHNLQKNALVLQAVSFLHKYVRLRGRCQESLYNTGRLFHQLGLVHVAVHYYKKVLVTEIERSPVDRKIQAMADLRHEAAFNLSLIYHSSGNIPLAQHYLQRYCTV